MDWSLVARSLHRWSAVGLVLVVVVALVVRALEQRARPMPIAAGVVAIGLAVGAWWTGVRLPWDQVGLWAVTVGTNMGGYRWVWSDNVRFVLARGGMVSVEEFQRLYTGHLLLGVAAVGPVVAVAVARRRRTDTGAEDT